MEGLKLSFKFHFLLDLNYKRLVCFTNSKTMLNRTIYPPDCCVRLPLVLSQTEKMTLLPQQDVNIASENQNGCVDNFTC